MWFDQQLNHWMISFPSQSSELRRDPWHAQNPTKEELSQKLLEKDKVKENAQELQCLIGNPLLVK